MTYYTYQQQEGDMVETKKYNGLQKAIRAVGTLEDYAARIGVTRTRVRQWLKEDGVDAPEPSRVANSAVALAIEKAGSQTNLARALGMKHTQSVRDWLRLGYVPLKHAPIIEHLYGIPRIELVSDKVRNAMGAGGEL